MKSSLHIIALVACVCSLAENLKAQENSGGMVAVLDVASVFEQNKMFNDRMEAIKAEADQFKTQMEQLQAQLQQKAEPLKEYRPGSPEFNALQAELEQETARLRTQAQQTNTDLLNREAKIYYDTYLRMQQVVNGLANDYNINLIIRFDSKPIDPENRGEVIKGVNRNIVFQRNLDLTPLVVEKMGPTVSTASVNNNLNQ